MKHSLPIIVSSVIFLAIAPAFAQGYTVKSVSCLSGTLNPSGTMKVGDVMSDEEIKKIQKIGYPLL